LRFFLVVVLVFSAVCTFGQTTNPPAATTEQAEDIKAESSGPMDAQAQPAAPAATQPVPSTTSSTASTSATQQPIPLSKQQPKRILGVMPNYRAVSAGALPPPPTPKEAFKIATQNSFDYSSFVFVGITSALAEWTDAHQQLGEGMPGFGRYYWRGFVDKTDGNYMVIFLFPTIFHQDERYFAMGEGGFWKRVRYASTRIFITPNYQGRNGFNYSELLGRAGSQAISTTYYPSSDRTAAKMTQKFAFAIGRDALTNVFREFWPDISAHLFHHNNEQNQ
jgi:hypothetical protein